MSLMPVHRVLRQNQIYVCLSCLLKESSRAGSRQQPYQNALDRAFSTTASHSEESNEVEGEKHRQTTRLQLLANYVSAGFLGKSKHTRPPGPVHTPEKSHSLLSVSVDPPLSATGASDGQEIDPNVEKRPFEQASSNNSKNVSKTTKNSKDKIGPRTVRNTQGGPTQPSSTAEISNEQDVDPNAKIRLLGRELSKDFKDASKTKKGLKDEVRLIRAPSSPSLRTRKYAQNPIHEPKYLRIRRRRSQPVKSPATAETPNVQDADLQAEKDLPEMNSSAAVALAVQDVDSRAENSLPEMKPPEKSNASKTAESETNKIPKTRARGVQNRVDLKHKKASGDNGAASVPNRSKLHSTDSVLTKAGKKTLTKKKNDVSSEKKDVKADIKEITATDIRITGMWFKQEEGTAMLIENSNQDAAAPSSIIIIWTRQSAFQVSMTFIALNKCWLTALEVPVLLSYKILDLEYSILIHT